MKLLSRKERDGGFSCYAPVGMQPTGTECAPRSLECQSKGSKMEEYLESPSSSGTASAEGAPDQLFLRILRRRKRWIMLGILLGCAAGVALYAIRGREYESTAQILVIKKRLETSPLSSGTASSTPTEDYLSTHQIVISSPRVVGQAVRRDHLETLTSFQDHDDPTEQIINSLTVARGSKKTGGTQTNVLTVSCRAGNADDCQLALKAVIAS